MESHIKNYKNHELADMIRPISEELLNLTGGLGSSEGFRLKAVNAQTTKDLTDNLIKADAAALCELTAELLSRLNL